MRYQAWWLLQSETILLPSISYLEGICNFFAHHADDGDDDDGDDDGDGDDDSCRQTCS